MEIAFAGASHHGLYGYRSLWKYFNKIYILSESSQNLLNEKRECDIVIDDFDESPCKLVYLCGYGKFIKKEQLERKTYINTHESLLPKYRGMHPLFYAVLNGDKKLGVSMHIVSNNMDAGDILKQFEFEYVGQSIYEIKSEIDRIVYENAGDVCFKYASGKIKPYPQNEKYVSYGAKRNYIDCKIDFTKDVRYLSNFMRALTYDYPNPWIEVKGEIYEVIPPVLFKKINYYGPIGRVVDKNEYGTWINILDGFMVIKNVRKDGKELPLGELVPIGYRF